MVKMVRMGRLARIHLRGKGQEIRKTPSVLQKHIKKIRERNKKSRQTQREYLEHHPLLGRLKERKKGLG